MLRTDKNDSKLFSRSFFLVSLIGLLLACFPLAVLAAEGNEQAAESYPDSMPLYDEATTDPTYERAARTADFDVIQFKLLQAGDMWVARVIMQLAEHEQLPAFIEVAIPQHSAVFHFGEDGHEPFSPDAYSVRDEDNFAIYSATMFQSRIATLEYTLPGSPFEQSDDGPSIRVSYTPFRDVEELWLIAALPPDSAVTDTRFRYIGSGPNDEPAFAYVVENAQGGEEYSTQIVYIANAGDRQRTDDNSLLVIALASLFSVAAIAVFWFFRRGRRETTLTLFLTLIAATVTATALVGVPTAHANDEIEGPRGVHTENLQGNHEAFVNLQYKVMLWEGAWTVTIRGKIDESATLPARVEIGVPAGSDVFWLGEVHAGFGEHPSGDPEIAPPYNVRTEGDIDIYTAMLTQTHAVQIEYSLPYDPRIETAEGPGLRITYTPLHDVEELWLAGATPPGTAVLDRDIHYLGTGPNDELAFAYTIENARGGQQYSEDIIFTTGITETESNIDPLVPIGIMGLVLLVSGIGIWFYRRNALKGEEE